MKNGIRLEAKKEASLLTWTIRRTPPPERVRIPLDSLSGSSLSPCVSVGSHVRLGEKIACPSEDTILNSTAPELSIVSPERLHASVSGEVTAIDLFPHTVLGQCLAIEIRSDGRDEKLPEIGCERAAWERLSPSMLLEILRDSGVTLPFVIASPPQAGEAISEIAEPVPSPDNDGRGISSPPRNDKTESYSLLILNGCESEPYVTSDHALMMSHPLEVLRGADILRKIYGCTHVVITLEDNKIEVAELLKSKIYFLKWNYFEIRVFKTLYPQGAPEILIQEWKTTGKTTGDTILNSTAPELSIVSPVVVSPVVDIATAFAVYEAVVMQKPLYERVVTVAGECVMEPKNLWVRLGTLFEDAIKNCRGFLREPERVIAGGPMRGLAQESLEVPVLKNTQALLALPAEVTRSGEVEACIRCGLCVEACPVFISPVMITLAAERDLFGVAAEWGVSQCIDCGNCTYICPAKRPMAELIRYAKANLSAPQTKQEMAETLTVGAGGFG